MTRGLSKSLTIIPPTKEKRGEVGMEDLVPPSDTTDKTATNAKVVAARDLFV